MLVREIDTFDRPAQISMVAEPQTYREIGIDGSGSERDCFPHRRRNPPEFRPDSGNAEPPDRKTRRSSEREAEETESFSYRLGLMIRLCITYIPLTPVAPEQTNKRCSVFRTAASFEIGTAASVPTSIRLALRGPMRRDRRHAEPTETIGNSASARPSLS